VGGAVIDMSFERFGPVGKVTGTALGTLFDFEVEAVSASIEGQEAHQVRLPQPIAPVTSVEVSATGQSEHDALLQSPSVSPITPGQSPVMSQPDRFAPQLNSGGSLTSLK
jgi:hypothetical protein